MHIFPTISLLCFFVNGSNNFNLFIQVEQSPSLQLLTSNTKSESRIGPEVDTNTGKNVSAGKGTRQTGTAANSGAILSSPDTSDYPAVYTTSDAAEVKKVTYEF